MKKSVLLTAALAFLLGGCSTMESAWDSTKKASGDAYDWVTGKDTDKKEESEK